MTRSLVAVLFVCFGLLLITAPASSAPDPVKSSSLDVGDCLIDNKDNVAKQPNYDHIEKVGDKLYRFQMQDGKVIATPVGEPPKPAAAPSPVAVAKPDSDPTPMPSDMPAELKTKMDSLKSVGKNINDELKKMDNSDHVNNVQAAIAALKQNPTSMRQQLFVIDELRLWNAELRETLGKLQSANVGAMQKDIVDGLVAAAKQQHELANTFAAKSKAAAGSEWQQKYDDLSMAADMIARAHQQMALNYSLLPIAQQLSKVSVALDYLDNVDKLLSNVRGQLQVLSGTQELLDTLVNLSVKVEELHKSVMKFSTTVYEGTMRPSSGPTSQPSTD